MCTGSSGGGSETTDRTDSVTLKAPTAEELALRQQFAGLSDQQFSAIQNELTRLSGSDSAFKLNLQDQQELDAAFNSARSRFNLESKDFADFSAGGRGLRMSDTPISQQAMDRLGLGLADIESQRANAGLNLGLASNQYRTGSVLGLGSAMPAAGTFNLTNYLQERMAQPTTRGLGTGTSTGFLSPSGLQTGVGLASGVGALGLSAASAAGLFGGGSAAALGTVGLGLA